MAMTDLEWVCAVFPIAFYLKFGYDNRQGCWRMADLIMVSLPFVPSIVNIWTGKKAE